MNEQQPLNYNQENLDPTPSGTPLPPGVEAPRGAVIETPGEYTKNNPDYIPGSDTPMPPMSLDEPLDIHPDHPPYDGPPDFSQTPHNETAVTTPGYDNPGNNAEEHGYEGHNEGSSNEPDTSLNDQTSGAGYDPNEF